ncbi:MAG: TadE/TadG family type IV pilus assembly protein [Novosphingobium sp.]
MSRPKLIARLLRDNTGSVVTEFALLGPTVLTLMLGVFQIGIGMQNYNAMRAVSFEVMRYAVVSYQTDNNLTNAQLVSYARSIATGQAYGLDATRLDITIADVTTPRVTGTKEKTLKIVYAIPTVLSIIGYSEFPIKYSQALFLVGE